MRVRRARIDGELPGHRPLVGRPQFQATRKPAAGRLAQAYQLASAYAALATAAEGHKNVLGQLTLAQDIDLALSPGRSVKRAAATSTLT